MQGKRALRFGKILRLQNGTTNNLQTLQPRPSQMRALLSPFATLGPCTDCNSTPGRLTTSPGQTQIRSWFRKVSAIGLSFVTGVETSIRSICIDTPSRSHALAISKSADL